MLKASKGQLAVIVTKHSATLVHGASEHYKTFVFVLVSKACLKGRALEVVDGNGLCGGVGGRTILLVPADKMAGVDSQWFLDRLDKEGYSSAEDARSAFLSTLGERGGR